MVIKFSEAEQERLSILVRDVISRSREEIKEIFCEILESIDSSVTGEISLTFYQWAEIVDNILPSDLMAKITSKLDEKQ